MCSVTTRPDAPNSYRAGSATSHSAPIVAGTIALMRNVNPCLTSIEIENILKSTTDPIVDAADYPGLIGTGRLNAYKAVKKAKENCNCEADLAMRDEIDDLYSEPNEKKTTMWNSPNIWIRNTNDGFTNPQYDSKLIWEKNKPFYVYVKVANNGCQPTDPNAILKLYWAKASTGLSWPAPWDGTGSIGNIQMGNPIGQTQIGTIDPQTGESFTIKEFKWTPPSPNDYARFGGEQGHFCLLARIEENNQYPFGMTTPEITGDLYGNVRNNNNIAWRNITITQLTTVVTTSITLNDGIPTEAPKDRACVIVRSDRENKLINLRLEEVKNLAQNNSAYDNYNVELIMDNALMQRWMLSGQQSEGLLFDGQALRILPQLLPTQVLQPALKNLRLVKDESYNICVQISQNIAIPLQQARDLTFNLVQYDELNKIIGGEIFKFEYVEPTEQNSVSKNNQNTLVVQKNEALQTSGQLSNFSKSIALANNSKIKTYPNPAFDMLTIELPADLIVNYPNGFNYSVKDISGRQVSTGSLKNVNTRLNVSDIEKGVYTLTISSENVSPYTTTFVKK